MNMQPVEQDAFLLAQRMPKSARTSAQAEIHFPSNFPPGFQGDSLTQFRSSFAHNTCHKVLHFLHVWGRLRQREATDCYPDRGGRRDAFTVMGKMTESPLHG